MYNRHPWPLKKSKSLGPFWSYQPRTTDTQWRHKSKKSENLGWCGKQNMLGLYLKIWEWEWIFGRSVKAISSPGVRSPWTTWSPLKIFYFSFLITQKLSRLCAGPSENLKISWSKKNERNSPLFEDMKIWQFAFEFSWPLQGFLTWGLASIQ